MSIVDAGPVLAAGAVLWRQGKSDVEVLLISRSRHDDVSLPKGKVDTGETLPAAAVREIREETGYSIVLGQPLGSTEYLLPGGRDKVVRYWAAEVTVDELRRGRFRPNDEVDKIEWLPIGKARKRLSYERDVEVLDRFAEIVTADRHRTVPVLVLRHAKAEGESPDGTDGARPLSGRGRQQADAIVSALRAYAPQAVVSSPARRCIDTVKPLARALGADVKRARALGQEAWEGPDADRPREELERLVAKRIAKGRTALYCSHSPVLPEIVDAVARTVGGERDGRLVRSAILSTAEFTVLHLSTAEGRTGLVAVESHQPLV